MNESEAGAYPVLSLIMPLLPQVVSEWESDLIHDMTKQLVFKSWDACAHLINDK